MSAWCSIRDSRIAGRVFSAQVGLDHALIGDYLPWGALRDQLAVVQHDKAVRDREHNLHQMLDHDDGDALLGDLADDGQRLLDLGGVEPGVALVQHQKARAQGEALGELEPLAPGEGEGGRWTMRHVGKAREFEMLAGDRPCLAHVAGMTAKQRAGGDVLHHRHPRERLHDLEGSGEAEPRDPVGPLARDVMAVEMHMARRGRMHAGDQVDQRGLAGAVRPNEADDLALVDVEADVVDGLEPAEPARDAIQGQKRRHFAIAFVGEPSRISASRPLGRNSTSTTMMTPRAATWMVRKLRQTASSKSSRMTAPIDGPKMVPSPPSSTITIGLTEISTSKTSGGSM